MYPAVWKPALDVNPSLQILYCCTTTKYNFSSSWNWNWIVGHIFDCGHILANFNSESMYHYLSFLIGWFWFVDIAYWSSKRSSSMYTCIYEPFMLNSEHWYCVQYMELCRPFVIQSYTFSSLAVSLTASRNPGLQQFTNLSSLSYCSLRIQLLVYQISTNLVPKHMKQMPVYNALILKPSKSF